MPLREARQDGAVDNDTGILVVRGDHGVLALITREMAYHHVAQGELDGEPWMGILLSGLQYGSRSGSHGKRRDPPL